MVLKKNFVEKYISPEKDCFLEQEPLRLAVEDNQCAAFEHAGFWQCMDTPREYQLLNDLWKSGKAPWTKYWK